MERARIGNITVHALNKGELLRTAHIVSLPISGTGAALAPVLLHIAAVYHDLIGGAFVKPCKISAQHAEVTTHCKSKSNMVVKNDTAVGADGNINPRLSEILVSRLSNLNNRRCLTPAYALCLTGDTNASAADAYLNKVCACLCQEPESVLINNVRLNTCGSH